PVSRLQEGERQKLVKLEEHLHLRVVGQDEAIKAVANAVRRARAGLQDPNRPLGSFIFLGPTGVGKTELSRALAEFLFDDENAMVIIMTSNIGSQYITEEESKEARRRLVTDALRAHFRPEFLNRVDEIIIFDRLSEDDLKKIVEIQLGRLSKRLEQQKITLKL